ncbi:molybdopterin converting factor subunit 1 [Limnoglobus roseus]|uniref:Molybdopterin synthase sulfur carrier subunit n=1 Tax=Limnoglobus roseus TaxID=2598579 RepID=A0A5C1ABG3_9BACT|nr:molybdopterin converting factor subunit 1 [Limnoglobus roseus]QEL14474.1 molybdopterin converting factor subunit 1 [Limnoglobus roseus]
MTLTVLLFARAKELVQRDAVSVILPPSATVGDLRSRLAAEFPQLSSLLGVCVIAVNHDFADDSRGLLPSDEIAVIPPVSGG